jgi:multidrug transporter EmrE-like cation transporter
MFYAFSKYEEIGSMQFLPFWKLLKFLFFYFEFFFLRLFSLEIIISIYPLHQGLATFLVASHQTFIYSETDHRNKFFCYMASIFSFLFFLTCHIIGILLICEHKYHSLSIKEIHFTMSLAKYITLKKIKKAKKAAHSILFSKSTNE